MVRHLCLAAVLSAISGCGTLELAALGANRMKWASAGIENYRMEVRGVCFCRDREATGSFIVDVAHGEIVKATYADDGAPVPSTVFLPTVEELFEDIRKAAISPSFHVDASYDSRLGYPTHTGVHRKYVADADYNYVVEYLHAQE